MDIRGHGGGCCGIRHISRARKGSQRENIAYLKQQINKHSRRGYRECIMLEVVLTDRQLRDQPQLRKALKEMGFKLVSRFKNRNSGNYCNVLHWRKTNELHGSPYWKED